MLPPLSPLDASNSLTPILFVLTTFFEVGIGVIAFAILCKFVPWLKVKAATYSEADRNLRQKASWGNSFLDYTFPKTSYPNGKPRYFWAYWLLLFARGSVYCGLGIVLVDLIGAKALVSPLTWDGLRYDILFARASATPDGAHVFSYLGVPIFGFLVMALYRDEFLGALAAAFVVAIHEGPWEIVYYGMYYQYLSWDLLIYVLKDISFAIMIILFILAFWKYPDRKVSMKVFAIPTIGYLVYLAWWVSIGLPITTINNYRYGTTIYHITQWWSSPFVNGIEVGSWIYICAAFSIATLLYWKLNR